MTGPPNPRTPHTTEFAAKARALRWLGKASPIEAKAIAMIKPPPTPCAMRASNKTTRLGATAQAALAARKNAAPDAKRSTDAVGVDNRARR